MGIDAGRRLTGYVDASAPTSVTLAGARGASATLDGKPVETTRSARGLTVAVPAGKHELVVSRGA